MKSGNPQGPFRIVAYDKDGTTSESTVEFESDAEEAASDMVEDGDSVKTEVYSAEGGKPLHVYEQ
jgi:hypothetical protein